ncbi:MAG: GWxTD domain-containing protein [Gemmatimonadetes bacterium]|nr:GWxTD domain-containing protein [Gemmatimonadota bacterium]
MNILLVAGLLLAVPAAPAAGPPDRGPDQSGRINPGLAVVDIVTSRGESVDSTRVDCYYRLSNELFNFVKAGDRFAARFELSLIVIDDDDYQVTAETIRDSVLVDTEAETGVMDHSRAKLYTTYLPPGKYDLEIKLYEQETGNQHDMARSFEVPDYYKDRLSISDIQFAGLVLEESSRVGLERRGIRIVPNLSRAFGEDHTDMYIYYEVYSDAAEEAQQPLSVIYTIKSSSGREMLNREEPLERQGHIGAYSGRFDTSGLSQGVYTLEVEVDDRAVRNRAKSKSEFHITWRFLLPLSTAKNFREITEQLRYIAKNEELNTLKKYRDAPAGEQKVALEAFWKRRDPTPETDRNEHMITYYRRIAYANEHFDDGLRKGWRSDQGRIYIVYGPPDEVERHTWDRAYSHPYQVWHYNNISRSFVFVDFDGYGRYQLYRVY